MEYEQWGKMPDYCYEESLGAKNEAFLFRISRAGCTLCNENFEIIREDNYPHYAVHILLEGYGFFQIEERNYFLKKGDIFLITPGQAHMYCNYSSSQLVLLWMELDGGNCHEIFSYFRSLGLYVLENQANEKLVGQLSGILSYLKETEEINYYECSGQVYVFLMYLLEAARTKSGTKKTDMVENALAYIDKNFTRQMRVNELTDLLHVSHTYLNRIFHKSVGLSPMKYIQMKRMEYACYLLKTTELSCEEISERIGMYDNASFYKGFKAVMGMTPVAYRNK